MVEWCFAGAAVVVQEAQNLHHKSVDLHFESGETNCSVFAGGWCVTGK